MKTRILSVRPLTQPVLFSLACLCGSFPVRAQHTHHQSAQYDWPDDPLVRQKLDEWQDLKFGVIIHWGLYAVPGIVESWALCSEDWIERDSTIAYEDFKKWYWGLKKDFNPVNFDPDQWAEAAGKAGMRYVVFTTKHHDGFNLFDTRETDFKITDGPFKTHPKANVAKYVFEAFRKRDFMIGAYFSKPDWHSEYYWWPKYATPDRNNNYDIQKYPWRWERFKQFTFNQISELMHEYGDIDILWLDGGWVRPRKTVNKEVLAWGAPVPKWSQDIDIPRIASMARKAQPDLLIVDRTVHGPYENYQTPEQTIPEEKLDHPWESCLTLGNAWGYVPGDRYKPASQIIHTLIEVAAKGGNLLLGVGPKPDGTLPQEVIQRLEEIGRWTSANRQALYRTRTVDPYRDGQVFFTRDKDNKRYYALACLEEGKPLPEVIEWTGNLPAKGSRMRLVESGKTVKWKTKGDQVTVFLPPELVGSGEWHPALAFSFTPSEQQP